MLNVKELFESLSDAEKEELKKLLLHHTDDVKVQSSKEDTFANVEIVDPLQQNEEVTIGAVSYTHLTLPTILRV